MCNLTLNNHAMKTLFISILAIGFAFNTAAQYNKLDAETVKKLRLYKVVEWTITTDSLNHSVDSSSIIFLYNRAGKLIEKDHDFNKDRSLFIATKYTYNAKGFLTDSSEDNPYTLIMGSRNLRPSSTASYYDDHGKIKTVINKWPDGSIQESNYGYDDQDLLYYIDIKTNVKRGTEIRFEYTFLAQ